MSPEQAGAFITSRVSVTREDIARAKSWIVRADGSNVSGMTDEWLRQQGIEDIRRGEKTGTFCFIWSLAFRRPAAGLQGRFQPQGLGGALLPALAAERSASHDALAKRRKLRFGFDLMDAVAPSRDRSGMVGG